ncbi:RNA-splicing factor [Mortierella sp. GBA43]|nr:RNA-splicing factor [Mortierella sp. GBA43]
MSYNGIGLSTARGSGTNGYVVRNLGHLKHRRNEFQQPDPYQDEPKIRKPNPELVAHEQKRSIEVKCATLQAELEDEGLDDEEIDRQVGALREKLTVLLEKATTLAATKAAEREAEEKAAEEARVARAAERAERAAAAASGKTGSRRSKDKEERRGRSRSPQPLQWPLQQPRQLTFPFSLPLTRFKVVEKTRTTCELKVEVEISSTKPPFAARQRLPRQIRATIEVEIEVPLTIPP